MAAYQSISLENGTTNDDENYIGDVNDITNMDGNIDSIRSSRSQRGRWSCLAVLAIAVGVCVVGDWMHLRLFPGEASQGAKGAKDVIEASSGDKADVPNNAGLVHGADTADTAGTAVKVSVNDIAAPHTGGISPEPSRQPLPKGVNFGSWLSLEDWFYVGENGAVEVATPDPADGQLVPGRGAASCLPPLHLDSSTGPRWNSETDLLPGLVAHFEAKEEKIGKRNLKHNETAPQTSQTSLGPWGKAIQAIHAFRSSYFDFETELKSMSELGITHVRVPVSWCWTDYNPSNKTVGGGGLVSVVEKKTWDGQDEVRFLGEEEVKEKYTCVDPFYGESVRWPAIPRSIMIRFLRACAKYGIGATIDLHTYPGGTSIGTFSGVWPRYARFWTHGDQPATDSTDSTQQQPDIGRTLLKSFISWLESLAESNPEAFKGLRALSPMNEPAHLAGLYNGNPPIKNDKDTFLPPLHPDMAQSYLQKLNAGIESQPHRTPVPDGNHLRVLYWLTDAIQSFRESTLPSLGKELHVNVHESLFPNEILPNHETLVDYGLHPGSLQVFGSWWRASTTAAERSSWAVLDIHHYHAWGGGCSGSVEGPPVGRYACSDVEGRTSVLSQCAQWVSVFRNTIEQECEPGLRLASAEFSASTHHSVRHACNDPSTLKMMLDMQVTAADEANVELFWWSYKMPYGGAFRRAWSLKHLLFVLGVGEEADEPMFHCGDHVVPGGEPGDMSL